jgi:hypothetical protein
MSRRTDGQIAVRLTSWIPKHLSPLGQRPNPWLETLATPPLHTLPTSCSFKPQSFDSLLYCYVKETVKTREWGRCDDSKEWGTVPLDVYCLHRLSVPLSCRCLYETSQPASKSAYLLSKTNPLSCIPIRMRFPLIVRLNADAPTVDSFGVPLAVMLFSVDSYERPRLASQ